MLSKQDKNNIFQWASNSTWEWKNMSKGTCTGQTRSLSRREAPIHKVSANDIQANWSHFTQLLKCTRVQCWDDDAEVPASPLGLLERPVSACVSERKRRPMPSPRPRPLRSHSSKPARTSGGYWPSRRSRSFGPCEPTANVGGLTKHKQWRQNSQIQTT